jgi:hypothetical protein
MFLSRALIRRPMCIALAAGSGSLARDIQAIGSVVCWTRVGEASNLGSTTATVPKPCVGEVYDDHMIELVTGCHTVPVQCAHAHHHRVRST